MFEVDRPVEPPFSKVYASDAEWYSLCKAGYALNMCRLVEEKDISRGRSGLPVLSGAMGVDKQKVVDGVTTKKQRFISILTPIHAYMRKLRGDGHTLPKRPC